MNTNPWLLFSEDNIHWKENPENQIEIFDYTFSVSLQEKSDVLHSAFAES